MIEQELLLRVYGPSEIAALADAFKILHQLRVCELQVQENTQRIVGGFNNKAADELAVDILQVQQTNRNLLALHEMAGNFNKDGNNESQS